MKFRKTLTGGVAAAVIATSFLAMPGVSSSTAEAQVFRYGYGYGPGYHRYHRWHGHHYRHRHGAAAAAGIFGLAAGALLGSALSQPRYYGRSGYYGRTAYRYNRPDYYVRQPGYHDRYGGYYGAVRSGSQINGGKHNDDPSQPIINY